MECRGVLSLGAKAEIFPDEKCRPKTFLKYLPLNDLVTWSRGRVVKGILEQRTSRKGRIKGRNSREKADDIMTIAG